MGQLLVREVDDQIIRALSRRAAEHGVSQEEEHRRLLGQCLRPEPTEEEEKEFNRSFMAHLLSPEGRDEGDDDTSWVFDRHDLRYRQALLPEGADFKAHLLDLGNAGADADFERPRTYSKRRDFEL